jgi:SAM-dependent methyltransferase
VEKAAPYAALAPLYDRTVGARFFSGLRRAFEELVRRYGLRFRSAVDLGCGTGLFACWLARRYGVAVLAVDRSPAMLQAALRNCGDCRVGFLQQDLRELHFARRVDLATANYDTMNHLLGERDFRGVLHRVWAALLPGGHFIFDLLTDRQLRQPRRITFRSAGLRSVRLWQRIRWIPRRALLVTRVSLARGGRERWEEHVERGYDPVQVARWLQETGFEIRALLDGPSLCLARAGSRRVVFVARRVDNPAPSSSIAMKEDKDVFP